MLVKNPSPTLMIATAFFLTMFAVAAWSDARERQERPPPRSDHRNGKTFFNPTLPPDSLPKFCATFRMLRDSRAKWPARVENTATPRLPERLGADEIALTFVNHATFLIQIGGINILTDPVWSKRVSPVSWIGPARVRKPGIDFETLPRIDLILISHNHYDHLDLPTLERLNRKFAPKILAPIGDQPRLASIGCQDVVELDWWEAVEIRPGLRVSFAPTQHQSNRGVFDRQRSLWGSYMVTAGNRRVYFGGDSGYSTHYAETKARLGAPDLALLPIGSYEPRWFMRAIHMNPEEAVLAHRDLGARQSVGMHFGTFQLSSEAIDQPPKDLQAALAAAGVSETEFIAPREGETRIYTGETRPSQSVVATPVLGAAK